MVYNKPAKTFVTGVDMSEEVKRGTLIMYGCSDRPIDTIMC